MINAKSTPINICNRPFIAKWYNSSWSIFLSSENPIEVLLVCLVNSVWSTIGHCVKYIKVVSANHPLVLVLLDSFSVEQPIGTGKLVWRTCDWSECRRKIGKKDSNKLCLLELFLQ